MLDQSRIVVFFDGEKDFELIQRDLEKQIEQAGRSKEAHGKATSELNKLKLMSPMSAEAALEITEALLRNFIRRAHNRAKLVRPRKYSPFQLSTSKKDLSLEAVSR